jgi:hypothetical protein
MFHYFLWVLASSFRRLKGGKNKRFKEIKVKSQRIFSRRWTRVFVKYSTLKIRKEFTVLLRLKSDSEQKPFMFGLCTLYYENQIMNESKYAYLLTFIMYPLGVCYQR